MKASEMLESVLCDPVGNPCVGGTKEDLRLIKIAIDKVKDLEQKLDYFYQLQQKLGRI